MDIQRITPETASLLHSSNEPFDLIGRLRITYENGLWKSSEEIFEKPARKRYPDYDGASADDYLNDPEKSCFFAFEDEICVGQILISKTWNNYAHVEDLSIREAYRGRGIGSELLKTAERWALRKGLAATSCECQDNNLLASRFLCRHGYSIGGINDRLYAQLGDPYATETAVFWYKSL